ncbi:transmembrane protein 42 [Phalacrocorax carbo]|uniref:transmembrane protein 42 n=1 Tax=Phalacrocorax carbo TaxID=9209 RepID=UPI0031192B41
MGQKGVKRKMCVKYQRGYLLSFFTAPPRAGPGRRRAGLGRAGPGRAGPCGRAAAAAAAGLLGAAAAAAAKLAVGPGGAAAGAWLPVLLRIGCVGLVFVCNAVMWTLFAKALRLSSSSATASVTATASNFISSAILGKLLFGESWKLLWWVGLAMTLCGLMLLHTAAPQLAHLPAEKKEA